MQRIEDYACYQVIPLMREKLLDGDCVTAGWGTHSVGGLIPGRFMLIIIISIMTLKTRVTLQAFAKSFSTSDG